VIRIQYINSYQGHLPYMHPYFHWWFKRR